MMGRNTDGVPDAQTILVRLAPRSGISLGMLQSGRFDEFRVLLASAASCVAPGAGVPEREVNNALRAWLAGPGVMLATDHVELRRWLVDTGLVERDGYGRRYRRAAEPPVPLAQALAAVLHMDAAQLVAAARAEDAARRAARRVAHAPGPKEEQ